MTTRLPAKGSPGYVLMDDEDAIPFLSVVLRIGSDGYVSLRRRNNLVARMILGAQKGQVVAYRSVNKNDLRRSNIYLTTTHDVMLRNRVRRRLSFSTSMVGVSLWIDRRYNRERQVYIVRMRLKVPTPAGKRKPRSVYSRTFTDIYEAGYAYNRLCHLIHREKRDVNTIPETEVFRILTKWGSDIPPGYEPERVAAVLEQGRQEGTG